MGQCADALSAISAQFAEKESKFWNSSLEITGFADVHEVAFRPWARDSIPRRFCTARVMTNDGVLRRVDYSVRENLGLFGWTWNVNWCVDGLDRHRSYAPGCQMARPGPER